MKTELSVHKDGDLFKQHLEARGSSLTAAGRRVMEFIDRNRGAALAGSAMDLAIRVGTSDATVVRAVQALGFEGIADLKNALASSVDTPAVSTANMQRTLAEVGNDSGLAIETVLKVHQNGLAALRRPASRKRILEAAATLQLSERILLFGVGPTGSIASYIATQLERSGRRIKLLNSTGIMLADQLLDLQASDSLLVIAYDPPYPEVMAVLKEGKRLGLKIVLVTDKKESKLAPFADVLVVAMRGQAERVALHGTTVICLEALVLSLAVSNRDKVSSSLEHLNRLRQAIVASSDKSPVT